MIALNSEACTETGVERDVNDAFSKVGFPFHEVDKSPEVISPHKPNKEFWAGVIAEEHKPAQEVSKLQKSKGWLKKAARGKGQAHSQESENKNKISGSKRQSFVVFAECEENIILKRQCGGFTGNLDELNLSAVVVRQHRWEP